MSPRISKFRSICIIKFVMIVFNSCMFNDEIKCAQIIYRNPVINPKLIRIKIWNIATCYILKPVEHYLLKCRKHKKKAKNLRREDRGG
jgi:hypothetical protein